MLKGPKTTIEDFKYHQYVQGFEAQAKKRIMENDNNLIECQIFKVNNHPGKFNQILESMMNIFSYGENRLKYLKNSFTLAQKGNFECLSLVWMSVKENMSIDISYFQEKRKIISLELVLDIAREMDKLHRSGIVHGCLTPENIYLDNNNKPQIINYGLKSIIDKNKQYFNEIENNDFMNLKGTVYEPPEMRKIKRCMNSSQIEIYDDAYIEENSSGFNIDMNSNFYTAKADVYSFGVLFYEILSRERLDINNMQIKNGSVFPGDKHFPDSIKTLINQCLSIDPSMRPSFPSIIKALEKIYTENPAKSDKTASSISEDKFKSMLKNVPKDVENLFRKAYQGDVESCLLSFIILQNGEIKIEGSCINIGININFNDDPPDKPIPYDKRDNDKIDNDKSGSLKIEGFVSPFFYPKMIKIPLISTDITTLTPSNADDSFATECYQDLKKISYETNDPNLLLYITCNKIESIKKMSKSPSMSRSSSLASMARPPSKATLTKSPSRQFNFVNSPISDYEDTTENLKKAAKFGSSDALVLLGLLSLKKIFSRDKFESGFREPSIENLGPSDMSEIAYWFKIAADMYNPYGMINLGIMLQHNEKYSLAGRYYKLASQTRLSINGQFIGLHLYNQEIEKGFVDDEATRKYDISKKRWVDWFLTMPVGRLFVRASDEYISKGDENSSKFQSSQQSISERRSHLSDEAFEDMRSKDYNAANEYGNDIYTSYSETADFIRDIIDKYQNTTDFPRCPRVLCYGQTTFPVGPMFDRKNKEEIQKLNSKMCVHFYCPRCNDFYLPSQVIYKNIPSTYFPRNYLPVALKELYKSDDAVKPFVQFVPTIFDIPMMEVTSDFIKKRNRSMPKKSKDDLYTDDAGFFLPGSSKTTKKDENNDDF